MVVVLGVDVHKKTHTIVAVDAVGRQLGELTVRATDAGHDQLLRWARRTFPGEQRRFAVEDCRNMSVRLERALLAGGESVVRVPVKLMARTRASARTRGKSDPIDAVAVARAALREPDLPTASHDTISREVKLLVDRREDLVGERARMINRFRWHLHELDPEQDPQPRALRSAGTRRALTHWLAHKTGMVARMARDILDDIDAISHKIDDLEKEITTRIPSVAPMLLTLPGCGPLTAAKLVGETADATRFRSDSRFAMHAGVAPIPVWSGNTHGRVRLTRGGNRQLNTALHRIAVTQLRLGGLGRAYYDKRLACGDSTTEALRCLKRRLARVVYPHLTADQHARNRPRLLAA